MGGMCIVIVCMVAVIVIVQLLMLVYCYCYCWLLPTHWFIVGYYLIVLVNNLPYQTMQVGTLLTASIGGILRQGQ